MRVTKYMEEMLFHAREVYRESGGANSRMSDNPCPFCVADEDAHWFEIKTEYGLENSEKPLRMSGPHCQFCPLLSLFHTESRPNDDGEYITVQQLMDDCVNMGKAILEWWEDRLEYL